jgi:hypothetical protein
MVNTYLVLQLSVIFMNHECFLHHSFFLLPTLLVQFEGKANRAFQ